VETRDEVGSEVPKDPYEDIAEPDKLVESVRRALDEGPVGAHDAHAGHGGDGPLVSIREAEHKGHKITIRTEYTIEVDGEPLQGHFSVGADGNVHYHSLPNYEFASAIDLVKKLIDAFPRDFKAKKEKKTTRKKTTRKKTTRKKTTRRSGGHHH
jgi:hypothetical protein